MRVHLGGSLNFYDSQKRTWLDLPVSRTLPLSDVADAVGIPLGEIDFAVVNGRIVPVTGTVVTNGDRVEFYSALAGG